MASTPHRLGRSWIVAGGVSLLLGALPGCDFAPNWGPSPADCVNAGGFSWAISVPRARVVDGMIEVRVGETIELSLTTNDLFPKRCDTGLPVKTVDWQLTNPDVALISGTYNATMQGRSPGETMVRATVHAPNGTTGTTTTTIVRTRNIFRIVP